MVMIKSKEDYKFYLEANRIANALPKKISFYMFIKGILLPDYIWRFQKTLRRLEYYKNCKNGIISIVLLLFITRRFRSISLKLGFTIPPNVFGLGLSIAHQGTIIINKGAKIGENCRLHACVNIGTKAGYSDKAPTIGDNCYIGPGVKMFGDISIGDFTAIGANAVVNKSFSEPNILIAGVPAKKVANFNTIEIIIPATQILKQGIIYNDYLSGLPIKELSKRIKDDIDSYRKPRI